MDRDSQQDINGGHDGAGGADGNDGRDGWQTASLNEVRYDKHTGLVPVVVQDIASRQVLMTAYANREALKRTYGTGQAWFWSRSRQSYWRKGETSGNVLHVREIRLDCDGDTVLFLVDVAGPACHTGNTSCFYRNMTYQGGNPGYGAEFAGDDTGIVMEEAYIIEELDGFERGENTPVSDSVQNRSSFGGSEQGNADDTTPGSLETGTPEKLVSEPFYASVLQQLWTVLAERYENRPQGSYTTFLFEHGMDKIAKKVGEEATEVVIAGKNAAAFSEAKAHGAGSPDAIDAGSAGADGVRNAKAELAQESADLMYHLLVLWKQAGISPDDVFRVLQDRTR
ncbi:phosphoribosyl-AMP cyclohydrolase [Alicyclobacillus sp. SO9]|uniref:phosphoribosyl-AMP cyclohydrolase n=1 Tax=Alicyclobacillus sp. SO9 TaxID=2665646 RepID=UPI0018E90139|nr:phosphoribosyl-AMP cyclohydrolase [Alicyclobacillus sp. SO9]QQE80204.1 phosphoribosyl-AMP cyclohydrolase [Alicyclobacillus sp. SO9]